MAWAFLAGLILGAGLGALGLFGILLYHLLFARRYNPLQSTHRRGDMLIKLGAAVLLWVILNALVQVIWQSDLVVVLAGILSAAWCVWWVRQPPNIPRS